MMLDDKDRTIISMYAKDPEVSQERIAKKIGLSQPSVAMRISKLRERGALENLTGINPLKLGLYLAKVDISSTRPNEILEMFGDCPYFANGFTISGKNNLCLFFFSESITTLESIVNGHIRSNPSVTDVDFNIVITSERDFIVPTVLNFERLDHPPCGMKGKCSECPSFRSKKCMGCPITGQYQGTFY
ncbi:MAG: Lrp/AsnC family transcriptional regulator [Methanomassiliicoccales archaeon]|nr:MAG: Lrp/AsnC family transcriptional regulator [Methanomassiliicoccales archaeon]